MRFQAPESLAEQIAQHLSKRIITGQLKPLERIQEIKIANELDVSRGSVREALLLLRRRHLIEIYPRKGAVVSELSVEHVNALYEIYIDLITLLVVKLAERLDDASTRYLLDHVRDIQLTAANASTPIENIVEAGFDLMSECCQVVKNPYLEEMLENFKPAVSRTYYLVMDIRKEELKQTMQFYQDIVRAIKEKNNPHIIRIIKVFGEHQREQVLRVLTATEKSA